MLKTEKLILKDLFDSVDGLFAFTFYSRYKIEPDEIIRFISKYQKKDVVIFENNKIYLTKEGRENFFKLGFKNKTGTEKFSSIPKEFLTSKLEINEPYLPNINNVSAEILKK